MQGNRQVLGAGLVWVVGCCAGVTVDKTDSSCLHCVQGAFDSGGFFGDMVPLDDGLGGALEVSPAAKPTSQSASHMLPVVWGGVPTRQWSYTAVL